MKRITTLSSYKFTRSFDLSEFIGNMEEIQDFCQNKVDKKREKVQVLKSAKLTPKEKARGYLKDCGTKPGFEFPFCIRCSRQLIDLPPQMPSSRPKTMPHINNTWQPAAIFNNVRMASAPILKKTKRGKISKKLYCQHSSRNKSIVSVTKTKAWTVFINAPLKGSNIRLALVLFADVSAPI